MILQTSKGTSKDNIFNLNSLVAQMIESSCNAGDLDSIPGLGRSPGEGNGYSLLYSGLENSTDCIVYGVAKSWTRLNDFHFSLFWKPNSIGKSILSSIKHDQGTGQLGFSLTNVLGLKVTFLLWAIKAEVIFPDPSNMRMSLVLKTNANTKKGSEWR